MKNAPITTSSNESALDKPNSNICGTLPARVDTVIAGVLANLIEGLEITGIAAVYEQSTTRLSAHIYRLENEYGWLIERADFAVGTNDGREAWVTRYWLPMWERDAAFLAGARDWITSVRHSSASRKKAARRCRASAAAKNAARSKARETDPRQRDLWGEA